MGHQSGCRIKWKMNKHGIGENKFPRVFLPRGKNGASILMIIFEVLVVLLIVFTITEAAVKMASSETVEKVELANEIVMMVDTLVGVPGDAIVEYPGNVSNYNFLIGQEKIVVFTEKDDVSRVERKLIVPLGYSLSGALDEKSWMCLEKKGLNILLRECNEQERAI